MNKTNAFSLTELMIVLGIISILIMMALPFSQSFLQKNELERMAGQVLSAIQFAKNEAKVHDANVILTSLSDDNDWSNGMKVFIDKDKNHQLNGADELLHVWRFDPKKIGITWHGFRSDHYLEFSKQLTEAALSGRFVLYLKSSPKKRQEIIINKVGRARQSLSQ